MTGPVPGEQWSATVSAALLGTATRRVSCDGADPVLSTRLRGLPPGTPAAELVLHTAALTAVAVNAEGPALVEGVTPLPGAADDPRAVMSPRLAAAVRDALPHPGATRWCLAPIARAGLRAPAQLIPALLRYTAGHVESRAAVTAIVGPRGQWVAAAAPGVGARLGGAGAPDRLDWEGGTETGRERHLVDLRRADPAAAADLLDGVWAELRAADRARLLRALAPATTEGSLEAIFERALDDRSSGVRAAAAEGLAGSTGTAFERRMRERAAALVRRRRTLLSDRLDVEPIGEPDAAALRDGIVWPPRQGISMSAQWIDQLTAALPLAAWEQILGAEPAKLVGASGEFRAEFRAGWLAAAGREQNPRWAAALAEDGDPAALAILPGPWTDRDADRVVLHFGRALAVDDWRVAEGLQGLIDAAAIHLPVDPKSPWHQRLADQIARGTASRVRLFAPLNEILRLRNIIEQELP